MMDRSFRLPCYLRLKRELGEIDACAECQEIAVREFLHNCKNAADPASIIQRLSRIHGIRVDSVDLERFAQCNTELQLVAVTQAFEVFLNDYIGEHPRLGSRESRDHQETLLDFIVRRLKIAPGASRALRQSLEYRVYNYYRVLRNTVAHGARSGAAVASAKNRGLDQLKRDCESCSEYQRLDAPNSETLLSFDDYVLFTRASKRLALHLCELGSFSHEELLNWARGHYRRRGSIERRANAIKTGLRSEFGVSYEKADPIVQSLLREDGLLA